MGQSHAKTKKHAKGHSLANGESGPTIEPIFSWVDRVDGSTSSGPLEQLISELEGVNLSERGIILPNLNSEDFVAFIDRIISQYSDLGALNIKLPHNLDDKSGCEVLQRLIERSKLKQLQITNKIDDNGIAVWQSVAAALKVNTSLTELNLSHNYSLGDRGFALICDSLLANQTLQVLRVNKCDINGHGFRALDQVLKVNTTLRCISAADNSYYEACRAGLEHNTTLRAFDMSSSSVGQAMIEYEQGPPEIKTFTQNILARNKTLAVIRETLVPMTVLLINMKNTCTELPFEIWLEIFSRVHINGVWLGGLAQAVQQGALQRKISARERIRFALKNDDTAVVNVEILHE